MHVSVGHRLPSDLLFDIEHYKGTAQSHDSSLSSTPDGLGTPPANKTPRLQTPDSLKLLTLPKQQQQQQPSPTSASSDDKTTKLSKIHIIDSDKLAFNDNNGNNAQVVKRNEENISKSLSPVVKKEPTTDNNVSCVDGTGLPKKSLTSHDNLVSEFFIREIPKSPHLAKDFSPSGERIRDSVRARRQQRMQQNRENFRKSSTETGGIPAIMSKNLSQANINDKQCEPDLLPTFPDTDVVLRAVKNSLEQCKSIEPTVMTQQPNRTKCRPYGEKGFIINVNEGLLTLNNVKDLDNCSDFDSSCDTSLNYVDVNDDFASNTAEMTPVGSPCRNGLAKIEENSAATVTVKSTKCIAERDDNNASGNICNKSIRIVPPSVIDQPRSTKSYKSALEDLKQKLNLCKTKLDSLETAGRETISNSTTSMRNYFKIMPQVHGQKASKDVDAKAKATRSTSMFGRIDSGGHVANANIGSAKRTTGSSKLFRINDTPIFERRHVRSLLPPALFRRSDSDEQIVSVANYRTLESPASTTTKVHVTPSTHVQRDIPRSHFEKTFSFKQKVSPTSDPKPTYNFNGAAAATSRSAAVEVSSNTHSNGSRHIKMHGTHTAKRTGLQQMPNKDDSAKRNMGKSVHMDSRSAGPAGKTNILSPERVHRLNAKLTEAKQQKMISNAALPARHTTSSYLYRVHGSKGSGVGSEVSVVRKGLEKFDKRNANKGCVLESTPL